MSVVDESSGDGAGLTGGALPVPSSLLSTIEACQADGSIDGELHAADTARWVVAVLAAHRNLRARDEEGTDPERDRAHLRMILTRWLHPARPR